jgi:hypothetical protein
MKTTEQKVLLATQIIALVWLGFCLVRQNRIDNLVKLSSPQKFIVVNTDCRIKGGSSISVNYEKGGADVDCKKSDCIKLNKGDSVYLYYSREFDFFYFPGLPSDSEYSFGVRALVMFLIWSVIPWRKFFTHIGVLKPTDRL